MFKKEEIKLIAFGIVASAYMTMAYDIIQEILKNPIDWNVLPVKALAGIVSMFIGIGVIYYLTRKKIH